MRLADLSPVKLLLPAIPLIVVAIAPASAPPSEPLRAISCVQPTPTPTPTPTPPAKRPAPLPQPQPQITPAIST
jgi:DNA polymerase-3 subunit gamma/tau